MHASRFIIGGLALVLAGSGCGGRQEVAQHAPPRDDRSLAGAGVAAAGSGQGNDLSQLPPERRQAVRAVQQKVASFQGMDPTLLRRAPRPADAESPVPWLPGSELWLTPQSNHKSLDPMLTGEDRVSDTATGGSNQGMAIVRPGTAAPVVSPVPAAAPAPVGNEGPNFASPNPAVSATVTAAADDALVRKLTQKAKDYPTDLSAQLDLQLVRFLMGEQVPQIDQMTSLPQEDRELLSSLIDGMSNFRSAVRMDNNMLLSRKVLPVLEMADRVRDQAELNIPTMVLCSRVRAFGVYEPMSSSFRAGQENQIVVYCEVTNFSTRQSDKQMWETKLTQDLVLYTESGLAVWRDHSDFPPDQSRNRRHDYYLVKKIVLPKTLTLGRYVLKVTVTDDQIKRVAENSVGIQLVAQ